MNNCVLNWPVYFALQSVFLAGCLVVWLAIRAGREHIRMPALGVFVATTGIFGLVTTIFADTCLYPEAIRGPVCAALPFFAFAADVGFPVLEVLVMREILVRIADGLPSAEAGILKSFRWCVIGGTSLAAFAFAFGSPRETSLPERATEFFTHTGESIVWILIILCFVWMACLNRWPASGVRWILGSFLVFHTAKVSLWTALQHQEDLWNTYGTSAYILLMAGLYFGLRAETAGPKSRIQINA